MEVQEIECHPLIPNVVASVSDNNLNVWNLQQPDTLTYHPLFDPRMKEICLANCVQLQQKAETRELGMYWQMIGVALGDLNPSKIRIWSKHPLGKGVLMKVLKHFERT